MRGTEPHQAYPELRELVVEASRALAQLDTARLEELALSCQALSIGFGRLNAGERAQMMRQAREAAAEVAVLGRVLDATRANVNVMNRLRELRTGRIEYSERQARGGSGVAAPPIGSGRSSVEAEAGHGDN